MCASFLRQRLHRETLKVFPVRSRNRVGRPTTTHTRVQLWPPAWHPLWPATCFCKQSLTGTQPYPCIYSLSMDTFVRQPQSGVPRVETAQPKTPKILTTWAFKAAACQLPPTASDMVLQVWIDAIRHEKNRTYDDWGEVKLSLFADNIIVHLENPGESMIKLPR